MAHSPEGIEQYVCTDCQVVYAGTPIHVSASDHRFEPPAECHVCGGTEFVSDTEWVRHHD
jgi:rubredoxin